MTQQTRFAVPYEPAWGCQELVPNEPTAPPVEPPTGGSVPDRVAFAAVAAVRRAVAEQLAERPAATEVRPLDEERVRGLVVTHTTAYADQRAADGAPLSPEAEQALAEAVFADMVGLGALQPFLNDELVENVDANGCDDVWVEYSDGRLTQAPALAGSDAELVDLVGRLARTLGQTSREFSTARPLLNVRLPTPGAVAGARLSATMAVSSRPQISLRRHRLVDVTLDDLMAGGTISRALCGFLRAAVRARKTIVVTGPMSAGKTTLLRALAAEFPRHERVATIETEAELALDGMPHRHARVWAVEAREATADAPDSGVELARLIAQALRANCRRVIVGEVRSVEIVAMLDVVANGHPGSLATIHARRGHSAIDRMVELATRAGLSEVTANRLIAGSVDFLVHLDLVEQLEEARAGRLTGRRWRYVDEVLEIAGVADSGRPAVNAVFRPGPDGRAVPAGVPPACLAELRRAGLDTALLEPPDALGVPVGATGLPC